jgi:phospholipase/carboxylesterase
MTLNYHSLPPETGTATSMVVLLHGVGADAADLIGLGHEWRSVLPQTLFISPDGPQPFDMAPFGRQWFSLQDFSEATILKGLEQSACPALAAFLVNLEQQFNIPANKTALVGFSQGAMTALYSVYRSSLPCAGVVAYSGMLAGNTPIAAGSYPPVMLGHGEEDGVVPLAGSLKAHELLKMAGVNSTLHRYPRVAHGISPEGLKDGGAFLKNILG